MTSIALQLNPQTLAKARTWTNARKAFIGISLLLTISAAVTSIGLDYGFNRLNLNNWSWSQLPLIGSITFALGVILGIASAKKYLFLNEVGRGQYKQVYHLKNTDIVIKVFNAEFSSSKEMNKEFLAWKAGQELQSQLQLDNPVPEFETYRRSEVAEKLPEIMELLSPLTSYGAVVFQKYIKKSNNNQKPHNIAHVLLFNWLVGRSDGKAINSIQDDSGKIWEIDNGIIGYFLCDYLAQAKYGHWLMDPKNNYSDTIVPAPLVAQIMNCSYIKFAEDDIPTWVTKRRVQKIRHRLNQNLVLLQESIRILIRSNMPRTLYNIQQCLNELLQRYSTDKLSAIAHLNKSSAWKSRVLGNKVGEINIEISPGKSITMPLHEYMNSMDVLRYLRSQSPEINVVPYYIYEGQTYTFNDSHDESLYSTMNVHPGDTLSLSFIPPTT